MKLSGRSFAGWFLNLIWEAVDDPVVDLKVKISTAKAELDRRARRLRRGPMPGYDGAACVWKEESLVNTK